MFYLGVYGDYNLKLLHSDSYERDRNLKIYPEYRKSIMDNIDLAIENARECNSLPLKAHFGSTAPYYIEICAMYEEKAKLLKDIQLKRHRLLSEKRCEDIGSDEVILANCPEINKLDDEFVSTYESIYEEEKEITHPARDLFYQPIITASIQNSGSSE